MPFNELPSLPYADGQKHNAQAATREAAEARQRYRAGKRYGNERRRINPSPLTMIFGSNAKENAMRICLTQAQKDEAAATAYKKTILAAMGAAEMTREALADKLGMSRATLRARLENTDTLTRGEDRRLRRVLRMEGTA